MAGKTLAAAWRGQQQPAAFQLFLLLPVLLLPATAPTAINCDIGIELGSQRQQQLGAVTASAAATTNNDSPLNLGLDEELDNSIPTTTKRQQADVEGRQLKPDFLEPIERRLDRLEFELRKSIHHQMLAGPNLAIDASANLATPAPPGNLSDASDTSSIREQQQQLLFANNEAKWSSLASRLALVEKFITITTSKIYETEQKVRQLERCDCRQSCKWRPPQANDTSAAAPMVTKRDGDVWSHECDQCSCHHGHVRCSHQVCPEPQCPDPQHLPGKCCPVCYKQCLYKSQTVRHGNKLVINSSQDTCKECMCIDGRLKCQRVAAASSVGVRGRRRATPTDPDAANDYYEEELVEGEESSFELEELEGGGGSGSRGKRHSSGSNSNTNSDSAAGQQQAHPPLVCPPVDCPPDKQFRILDDCCNYCLGHDFCRHQANCHPKARCDNVLHHQTSALEAARPIWPLSSMFHCQCRQGYEGDGSNCRDIDECAEWSRNECDSKTTNCLNLAGSYQCRCKRGFRLPPDLQQEANNGNGSGLVRNCLDLNECADGKLNRCHSQARCINLPGSYRCQCKRGYLGNGLECHKWFSAGPDVAAYLYRHAQGEAKVSKPLDELDAADIDDDPGINSLTTKHQPDEDDDDGINEPPAAELSDSKWEPLSLWAPEPQPQPQQSPTDTNQVATTATTAAKGWPAIESQTSLNTRTMFFQPPPPPRFYGRQDNVTTTTTTTTIADGPNRADSRPTTEANGAESDTNEPVYIPGSSQPVSHQQESRQTASTSTSTGTLAEPGANVDLEPSSPQPPTISPATYVTVVQQQQHQQGSIQTANNNSPSFKRGTIIASATTSPNRGSKAAFASSSTSSSSFHKSKALGVTSAAKAAKFTSKQLLTARQDFQPILAIFSSLIIYHIIFTAFVLNH